MVHLGSLLEVPNYVPRIVDEELVEAIREHPALLLVGPRGAGKTTTARRHASSIVRLDSPAEAAASADADSALASFDEPVLLDEWQAVRRCSPLSSGLSTKIGVRAGSF